MLEVLGKKYLNDKEASQRYGLSRHWFVHERWKGTGPKFVRFNKSKYGHVYYPLEETDNWFKERMISDE